MKGGMQIMKRHIINKSGVALISVILVFFIFVTLLGALFFGTVSNRRNAMTANEFTAAYYVAESGLNIPMSELRDIFSRAQHENWGQAELELALVTFLGAFYGENEGSVQFVMNDNLGRLAHANVTVTFGTYPGYARYNFIQIESTGYVGDISRTVVARFGYRFGQDALGGIVAKGDIIIDYNGVLVVGPIFSNFDDGITTNNPEHGFVIHQNDNCEGIEYIALPEEVYNEYKDIVESWCPGADPRPEIRILENQEIIFRPVVLPIWSYYHGWASQANRSFSNGVLDLRYKEGDPTFPDNSPSPQERMFRVIDFPSPTSTSSIVIELEPNGNDDDKYFVVVDGKWKVPPSIRIKGKGIVLVMVEATRYDATKKEILLNSKIEYLDDQGVYRYDDPTRFSWIIYDSTTAGDNCTLSKYMGNFNSYNGPKIETNKTYFNGSILTDSCAPVYLRGEYTGFFVTPAGRVNTLTPDSVVGTEGDPIWIYAPNAIYTHQASASMYGSVMVSQYQFSSSNPSMIYSPTTAIYPFFEWTPLPYLEEPTQITVVFLPVMEK